MNVIWTGFAMTAIGVCLSFYVTQRRIWVGVSDDGGAACEMFLAAASRKDRESFRRSFEALVKEIRRRAR
jgi:cytochrome c biogenesis protein ResB